MKIQTETRDGWQDCWDERPCTGWQDVIDAGWKFLGLDKEGNVIMTRGGYINSFRQVI